MSGLIRRVLALLVLMVLGGQAGAQVVGPPDPYGPSMDFFADFPPASSDAIPVGNSPPNYGIQGQAVYSREIHIPPNYPVYKVYTNVLEVVLTFSSPPEDAWILEKESDGTFSRVAEITNLFDDTRLDQTFTLTVDEVHSLVAGNWYEEADFATSNYLGNLVPDYNFATGPRIPDVVVQPSFAPNSDYPFFSQYFFEVIAPDSRAAKVVFDGSQTVDPYYLPVEYSWTGWTNLYGNQLLTFTNSGVLATNVVPVGEYLVTLTANDVVASGWPYGFELNVITPKAALDNVILDVGYSVPNKQQRQLLTGVLSIAEAQIGRGQTRQGCNQLELYLWLVRISRFNTQLTQSLSSPVQEILNALAGQGR